MLSELLPGRALAWLPALLAIAACGGPPASSSPPIAPPARTGGPLSLEVAWARPFDLSTYRTVDGLARAPSGELVVVASGDEGAWLFALDAEGKPRWEAALREAGEGYVHTGGVGFDVAGNVVLAGSFASKLELGGRQILQADRETAFVASFDKAGGLRWAMPFTGEGMSTPILRVDARGESLLLAGSFTGNARIGDRILKGTGAGDGVSGTLFVARLEPTGAVRWTRELPGKAFVNALLDDGAGGLILAGDFFGRFTFEGFPALEGKGSDGRGNYLAGLDGTGKVRWVRSIGAAGVTASSDGAGSVFFCGGPWERFGHQRLGGVDVSGKGALDRELELLSCTQVANGPSGRLFVSGEIQVGEPDPKSGGVTVAARILDLEPRGAVVAGLTLPLTPGPSTGLPVVSDGRGGGFVAGSFIEFEQHRGQLLLYRLVR